MDTASFTFGLEPPLLPLVCISYLNVVFVTVTLVITMIWLDDLLRKSLYPHNGGCTWGARGVLLHFGVAIRGQVDCRGLGVLGERSLLGGTPAGRHFSDTPHNSVTTSGAQD